MPELPEVETTKRGIQPNIEAQTICSIMVRNPSLRWPVPAELTQKLPGLVVLSVKRRAKYLLLETAQGHLIIHLGMSGNLRVVSKETPPVKHDHIDLVFENGLCLRYHDPRRFGCWLWTEENPNAHVLLKNLGPEPLTSDFNATQLYQASRQRKTAIKTFIMNNANVVGVGNIYANEALFLSKLHPKMPAGKLTKKQTDTLVNHIKQVLASAIEQGGTTLKDFLTPSGQPGYFEQHLNVYGRAGQACLQCNALIEKILLNQRTAYFCPTCQPTQK